MTVVMVEDLDPASADAGVPAHYGDPMREQRLLDRAQAGQVGIGQLETSKCLVRAVEYRDDNQRGIAPFRRYRDGQHTIECLPAIGHFVVGQS